MGDNIHSPGHCSLLLRTFSSLLSLMLFLSSSSLTLWPLSQSLLLPSFQLLPCPCILSQSFFHALFPCSHPRRFAPCSSLVLEKSSLLSSKPISPMLIWHPPNPICWCYLSDLLIFFLYSLSFLSWRNIVQASLWCEYLNQIWYSVKAHQPEI